MPPVLRVLTPLSIAWIGIFPLYALAADTLSVNQSLAANQKLTSSDGRYTFNVQGDGNLVLRNTSGAALWSSGSNGSGGNRLTMQSDGNLVLYTGSGSAVWKTATSGSNAVKVVMQTDGNLVMRTSTGAAVWATGTSGGNPADTVKPVITLTGSASMSIVQGSSFTDPGASASDDRDGNITSKIVVSGSVNTGTVGSYTLSYNVKDAAGNAATTQTRTVTVTAATNTSKITLPIEVFGPSGSYVDVPVNLSNPAAITHLYLRCNACGYDDIADNRNSTKTKASVRINGGPAIALKHFIDDNGTIVGNSNIAVIGGEAKYGGIGGTFRSVRFTVKLAANQLRTGANTLRFEHVNPAPPSMGYRIIDLNFLENSNINSKY